MLLSYDLIDLHTTKCQRGYKVMNTITFPQDFMLGAATAAHQVEGNNTNSDCWIQEQFKHSPYDEPSGLAVDQYHRYEEDIKLLADAGLNAYRFSIEWARVEPREGEFNSHEIEHYRSVIACCKEYNVEPVVTLHHFSSPVWLIQHGGWLAESTVQYFERYVRYVIEQLGSELNWVCTINEANMGLQVADLAARYHRQMLESMKATANDNAMMGLNLETMLQKQQHMAQENIAAFETDQPALFVSPRTEEQDIVVRHAHQRAVVAIHELAPHIHVGLTLSLHDIQSLPGGEEFAQAAWYKEFLSYLPYIQNDDFIGVQNYTRSTFGPDGMVDLPLSEDQRTQMRYENYPQALEHVIRKVHEDFTHDIVVTENGIAIADDSKRQAFINQALRGVSNCLQDGLPVRGYFHWSLIDNFEWQKGYAMTYGLIACNHDTLERKPKASLALLGSFAPQR